MSGKFKYKCCDCGKEYEPKPDLYVCPECSQHNTATEPPKGVFKTLYNFTSAKKGLELWKEIKDNSLLPLLPINSLQSLPFLKVGNTPMYQISNVNDKDLEFNIFLKDDSSNPTFSFKDRASQIVSAYAKENNIDTIIAASTGNAGSSLAGICASQKQKAIIFVPAAAPKAKLTQIVMYGATIVPVDGTYDNAFDLSVEATKNFGFYNRNTAFNPLTIEGKKTVSYEIFDQLNCQIPDKIFVPVGDGVIISGVYKGFEDLLTFGIIDKMPTIVAVQAEGSDNIVRNLNAEKFVSKPSKTTADSISVDIPRNFNMTRNFIKQYQGETAIVSDEQILQASKILSKNTGIFAEPAAATAFAGILLYMEQNKIHANEKCVVMLTGSGLKDLNSVQSVINIPSAIKPDMESLKQYLNL